LSVLGLALEDGLQTSQNVRWKGSGCWPAGEDLQAVKTFGRGHYVMVRPWRPV